MKGIAIQILVVLLSSFAEYHGFLELILTAQFPFQNWFAKTFEKILMHILTKCSGISFAEYIALYMFVVDHNFQKNPSFFPPWP